MPDQPSSCSTVVRCSAEPVLPDQQGMCCHVVCTAVDCFEMIHSMVGAYYRRTNGLSSTMSHTKPNQQTMLFTHISFHNRWAKMQFCVFGMLVLGLGMTSTEASCIYFMILSKVGGGWSYSEHEMLAGLCTMSLPFPCSSTSSRPFSGAVH